MFESLAEMFPSVKRVLGDRAFLSLAVRYAVKHPPVSYNLSAAGERVPEFLPGDPLTGGLPFLPDLAGLDRAAMRAFHAWAEPPVEPGRFAAIDAERLGDCRFRFQPETALIESRWPVVTIRELREAPDSEFRVQIENNPERAVVHRSGYDVVVRRLDPAEHTALAVLMNGGTVWEALEAAGRLAGASELPVSQWFQTWVSSGMLAAVETPPA